MASNQIRQYQQELEARQRLQMQQVEQRRQLGSIDQSWASTSTLSSDADFVAALASGSIGVSATPQPMLAMPASISNAYPVDDTGARIENPALDSDLWTLNTSDTITLCDNSDLKGDEPSSKALQKHPQGSIPGLPDWMFTYLDPPEPVDPTPEGQDPMLYLLFSTFPPLAFMIPPSELAYWDNPDQPDPLPFFTFTAVSSEDLKREYDAFSEFLLPHLFPLDLGEYTLGWFNKYWQVTRWIYNYNRELRIRKLGHVWKVQMIELKERYARMSEVAKRGQAQDGEDVEKQREGMKRLMWWGRLLQLHGHVSPQFTVSG